MEQQDLCILRMNYLQKSEYNNLRKREILHIFIKTKWLMIWLTVICLNGTYKDIV